MTISCLYFIDIINVYCLIFVAICFIIIKKWSCLLGVSNFPHSTILIFDFHSDIASWYLCNHPMFRFGGLYPVTPHKTISFQNHQKSIVSMQIKWENWNHLFCFVLNRSSLAQVVKVWSRSSCICGIFYRDKSYFVKNPPKKPVWFFQKVLSNWYHHNACVVSFISSLMG
jgi:hypothetical protein